MVIISNIGRNLSLLKPFAICAGTSRLSRTFSEWNAENDTIYVLPQFACTFFANL